MGLFDKLFDIRVPCPKCGTSGAKVTLSGVRCPSPACASYDASLAGGAPAPISATPIPATPIGGAHAAQPPSGAPVGAPIGMPITIAYVNHHGIPNTFAGDRRTIRDRGLFLSVCVAPSEGRISLRKDRIGNLAELEAEMRRGPRPSKHEAYVLRYHAKRGTTSALVERLRANYPGW